jgi:hypothetical protein
MQSRVLSETIYNIMSNAAVRVRNGVTKPAEETINRIVLRTSTEMGGTHSEETG